MHYPDTVLSAIEREPIVYWGCTWSEIVKATTRGVTISLPCTLLIILIPLPVSKIIVVLPFIGIWAFVTRGTLRKISKLRTGKPLFYEKHVTMVRRPNNKFINPTDLKQCERNRETNAT